MHVCLICIEFFGFGIYGGFGKSTRLIGSELAKRGIQVTAVIPRRSADYPDDCEVDGIAVRQFNPRAPGAAFSLFRSCNADIYHSEDTSMGTVLAMAAMPGRRHMITFRDTMDSLDWRIETELSGKGKIGWRLYRLYIDNPLVGWAVRRADGVYCAADFLAPKVEKKYRLSRPPRFLPTPVRIPGNTVKAQRPVVCFVGRWEKRKRPERFFELARRFPDVGFIAVGGAQDREWDFYLRGKYGTLPNLTLTGFINQFESGELSRILGESWIIVNTSPREGLPNAFLEAAAHRCAVLSITDPQQFASKFGCHAGDEDLDAGLKFLLAENRWRILGERGWRHVKERFSLEKAIESHISAYERVLADRV